mmetsp:Transcript_71486/g.209524  ORF Transcript_71486/g.209524 Transcript_71486/m.209524 type:complete len:241 (-) Transcript_71486:765-1487(-)
MVFYTCPTSLLLLLHLAALAPLVFVQGQAHESVDGSLDPLLSADDECPPSAAESGAADQDRLACALSALQRRGQKTLRDSRSQEAQEAEEEEEAEAEEEDSSEEESLAESSSEPSAGATAGRSSSLLLAALRASCSAFSSAVSVLVSDADAGTFSLDATLRSGLVLAASCLLRLVALASWLGRRPRTPPSSAASSSTAASMTLIARLSEYCRLPFAGSSSTPPPGFSFRSCLSKTFQTLG